MLNWSTGLTSQFTITIKAICVKSNGKDDDSDGYIDCQDLDCYFGQIENQGFKQSNLKSKH